MSKIEFYFSIGSRYSYLAYTQLKRLEDSYGCKFELKPLNSFRVISSRPDNPFANAIGTGQYDWSYREKDAHRWAKYYGVPFIEPRGRIKFDADMLAKACYAAKELGGIKAYSKELFHAMFVEPWINVIDLKECISRAEKCDLSISKFKNLIESDDLQKVFRQVFALVLTSSPHSLHFTNAISISLVRFTHNA